MTRPSWDETWMATAEVFARRSVCDRAKVGAVIVSPNKRVVATGYNGPPAGMDFPDRDGSPQLELGCRMFCARAQNPGELHAEYWDCPTIHAEQNALLYSSEMSRKGGSLFVTGMVCIPCAKVVANSGLGRVVCKEDGSQHRNGSVAVGILRSAGLIVEVL